MFQISVGARNSKLSRAQIDEVLEELRKHVREVEFIPYFLETTGDLDQETSLRDLGRTDFFTRELDVAQAHREFRISIHSAKDLPEHLHPDLEIIAMTAGVDPSDALIIPEEETLESLPAGAVIATSSERREKAVQELRPDLTFCDIRGDVLKRLEQLDFGRVDGVVIAEAALIRLKLTHLNRITLPGETVPMQGRLAIVALKGDSEMTRLFSQLDTSDDHTLSRPSPAAEL
jgi:hydroxymethylbilane synthase